MSKIHYNLLFRDLGRNIYPSVKYSILMLICLNILYIIQILVTQDDI